MSHPLPLLNSDVTAFDRNHKAQGCIHMEKERRVSPIITICSLGNTHLFVMAVVFILATSCLSTQKAGPPPQKAVSVTAQPKPLAPMPILVQRIQALERCTKEKEMAEDDQKAAKEILSTYRALQMAASKALTLEDQERLIQKLFYSLMLVEEKFFGKNMDKPKDPSPRKATISIRELQFPLPGKGSPKPARTITATGPFPPVDDGKALTAILPTEDTGGTDSPDHPVEASLDLNLLFREVNSLVKDRKYGEAGRLLSEAERKTGAGPAREIILRAKEQINAEKESAPMPEAFNDKLALEIENEAKNLLEKEKFEDAISRLHTVEKTSSKVNERQLAQLKESAVNGLINRERNRAAKIFLKAKKIDDPTLKREKLSMSRDILANLILDYPNSSLVPTLKQNLEVVEQTLQTLNEQQDTPPLSQ